MLLNSHKIESKNHCKRIYFHKMISTCVKALSWSFALMLVPTSAVGSTSAPSLDPTSNLFPESAINLTSTVSPSSSDHCCSHDFKHCSDEDWCNLSESNCGNCNGHWISTAPKTCLALWDECTKSSEDCCGLASCQGKIQV